MENDPGRQLHIERSKLNRSSRGDTHQTEGFGDESAERFTAARPATHMRSPLQRRSLSDSLLNSFSQ